MNLNKLNGFGRPVEDLSLTSLWSGLYAPTQFGTVEPIVPSNPFPTYEIVEAQPSIDNNLNPDVTTSIVTYANGPVPAVDYWIQASGDGGDVTTTYGCMDVVETSDGYVTISNFVTNASFYNALSNSVIVAGPITLEASPANCLTKYSKVGNWVWTATTQCTGSTGMQTSSLAVDSRDNIVEFQLFSSPLQTATAYSSTLLNNPPTATSYTVTSPDGAMHCCLTKRFSDGMPQWITKIVTSTPDEYVYPIRVVTIGDDIYVYFSYQSNADVYSARVQDTPEYSLTSTATGNGGLAKFSRDGVAEWTARFGQVPFLEFVDANPARARLSTAQQTGDMCTDGVNLFINTCFAITTNVMTYVAPDESTFDVFSSETRSMAILCVTKNGFLKWSVTIDVGGVSASSYSPQSIRYGNGKIYVAFIFSDTVTVTDTVTDTTSISTTAVMAMGLLVLNSSTGKLLSLNKLGEGEYIYKCTYEVNSLTNEISYMTLSHQELSEPFKIFDFSNTVYTTLALSQVAPSIVTIMYNQVDTTQQYLNTLSLANQDFVAGGWLFSNTLRTSENRLLLAAAFSGIYVLGSDVCVNVNNFGSTAPGSVFHGFQQPPSSNGYTPLLLNYYNGNVDLSLSVDSTPTPKLKYVTYQTTLTPATLALTVYKNGQEYNSITLLYNGSTISLYFDGMAWYVLSDFGVTYE